MIACFCFEESINSLPRLSQLLSYEFQHNIIIFENDQTIFVYNANEMKVKQTMVILQLANIEVGFGLGKSKKEAYQKALYFTKDYSNPFLSHERYTDE